MRSAAESEKPLLIRSGKLWYTVMEEGRQDGHHSVSQMSLKINVGEGK